MKIKSKLLFLVTGLLLGFVLLPMQKVHAQYSTSVGSQSIFSITSPDLNAVLPGRECNVSTIGGSLGEGIGGALQTIVSNNWDAASCANAKGDEAELSRIFNNPSVLNTVSNVNAAVLNQRPASGVDFIEEKVYAITNPGKVFAATNPEPSTYYPGAGSELLRPIQGFWGWSVNLVFGFLILIIIVVAFAIMFRQRLGGAAEVTLQTAIPSIALAMILIPLSYAISGLFIDAITLGTNAVHGFLLGPQSPGAAVYANRANKDKENCDLQNNDVSIGGVVECDRGYYADDPLIDVWRAKDRIDLRDAATTVAGGVSDSLGGINAQGIFNFISGILNIVAGGGSSNQYAWFGNIVNIVVGLLTIWIAIKIFFKLIGKYLTLIIMPAFSPFIFATAALPGNGTKSIVQYLKTMGSAALFYIVTYAMFLLTLIFTDPVFQASLPDFRTSGYIPPLLGIQGIIKSLTESANSFPLTQLLMTLVGLAIYFSIPKTLEGIDDALGTKFVLPQLLKTPFESMQESFKITTRAFPAAAARATRVTAGGVRNIGSAGVNAGFNIQRLRDRAYGFADDDPRSAVYKRRQSNTQARQRLLAQLDEAEGKPIERARIQAQLASLDASEGLQGKEFSTKGEEGKDRSIKVSLQYLNSNDVGAIRFNFLNGDKAEVRNQMDPTYVAANRGNVNLYSVIGGVTYLRRSIAKVIVEPNNFDFANPTTVTFAGITKGPDGIERYDPAKNEFATWKTPVGAPAGSFAGDDIFMSSAFEYGSGEAIGLGTALAVRAGPAEPPARQSNEKVVPVGGKKIEILVDLYIDVSSGINTFDSLFKTGTGIIARGIQTPKRAVKVGPYGSNAFRVQVGVGTR